MRNANSYYNSISWIRKISRPTSTICQLGDVWYGNQTPRKYCKVISGRYLTCLVNSAHFSRLRIYNTCPTCLKPPSPLPPRTQRHLALGNDDMGTMKQRILPGFACRYGVSKRVRKMSLTARSFYATSANKCFYPARLTDTSYCEDFTTILPSYYVSRRTFFPCR